MYIFRSVVGKFVKINICCFNQFLAKIYDFGDFFEVSEHHFFSFISMGNRQSQENFLKTFVKVFGDVNPYPKHVHISKTH